MLVVVGGACFGRDAPVASRQIRNQCTIRKRQHAWVASDDRDCGIRGFRRVDLTRLVYSYYRHDKWQCANIISVISGDFQGRPKLLSLGDGESRSVANQTHIAVFAVTFMNVVPFLVPSARYTLFHALLSVREGYGACFDEVISMCRLNRNDEERGSRKAWATRTTAH